tara:strand:+ start:419 stop:1384 length:966 start_codon:yes stop_codon:yes gene_type:complete
MLETQALGAALSCPTCRSASFDTDMVMSLGKILQMTDLDARLPFVVLKLARIALNYPSTSAFAHVLSSYQSEQGIGQAHHLAALTAPDDRARVKFYLRGCRAGCPISLHAMHVAYLSGTLGMGVDVILSYDFLQAAARSRHPRAQMALELRSAKAYIAMNTSCVHVAVGLGRLMLQRVMSKVHAGDTLLVDATVFLDSAKSNERFHLADFRVLMGFEISDREEATVALGIVRSMPLSECMDVAEFLVALLDRVFPARAEVELNGRAGVVMLPHLSVSRRLARGIGKLPVRIGDERVDCNWSKLIVVDPKVDVHVSWLVFIA